MQTEKKSTLSTFRNLRSLWTTKLQTVRTKLISSGSSGTYDNSFETNENYSHLKKSWNKNLLKKTCSGDRTAAGDFETEIKYKNDIY